MTTVSGIGQPLSCTELGTHGGTWNRNMLGM